MIKKEAWYRELVAQEDELPVLKGEGRFKPSPPKPGQSLEEWYQDVLEQERQYDINRRHNLRYRHNLDIPRTPEQEEEQEIDELVLQKQRALQRRWDRVRREKERGRAAEDPEYAQYLKERDLAYKKTQKELHKKRMREDPAYAETYREKERNRYRKNVHKERERGRLNYEKSKQRMEEDPEYAEKVRAKKREVTRRYRKNVNKDKERAKSDYEKRKQRMKEDPEYAEEFLRKKREYQRRSKEKKRKEKEP